MKKYKIIAMVLVSCVALLTGCAGKSLNITLAPTNTTSANFISKNLNEVEFIATNAEAQITNANDLQTYKILKEYALSGESFCLSVVSTIDFCMEISNQAESSGIDQKIYEYGGPNGILILVSKVSGKSNVFSVFQYYGNVEYADIVKNQIPANAENKFTITYNKASYSYSFSDTTNGVVGEFIYKADGGFMKIEMSYKFNLGGSSETINSSMEFYNYKNGILGGRFMVSALVANQKQSIIFEYLAKQFDKRAKIGVVKNEKEYYKMEATEETKIAVSNNGDLFGFSIMYVNNSESYPSYTKVEKYGVEA